MKRIFLFVGAFCSLSLAVFANSPAESEFFETDSDDTYFSGIEFLAEEGIVHGYADGTYLPDNPINRAEFLKIIVEAYYNDEFETYSDEQCFYDVKPNEWYTKYVCFAEAEGIINGYDDGNFRPSNTINLVEALKVTLKTFGYEYEESDPWYRGLVEKSSSKNFIPFDFTGFGEHVNRGQMADLVARIIKNERGELDEYLGYRIDKVVTYQTLANGISVEGYAEDETLLVHVCGASPNREGGRASCTEEKEKIWGCYSASEVSYGSKDFVVCQKRSVSKDEVLVFGGGLLSGGYNLMTEGEDPEMTEVVELSSLRELSEWWGEIKTSSSAIEFLLAYTADKEIYSLQELKETFGKNSFLEVDESTIKYSGVVKNADGSYEIALYHGDTFGCSPFKIHEVIYTLSSDLEGTEVSVKESKTIGDKGIEGLCVD